MDNKKELYKAILDAQTEIITNDMSGGERGTITCDLKAIMKGVDVADSVFKVRNFMWMLFSNWTEITDTMEDLNKKIADGKLEREEILDFYEVEKFKEWLKSEFNFTDTINDIWIEEVVSKLEQYSVMNEENKKQEEEMEKQKQEIEKAREILEQQENN